MRQHHCAALDHSAGPPGAGVRRLMGRAARLRSACRHVIAHDGAGAGLKPQAAGIAAAVRASAGLISTAGWQAASPAFWCRRSGATVERLRFRLSGIHASGTRRARRSNWMPRWQSPPSRARHHPSSGDAGRMRVSQRPRVRARWSSSALASASAEDVYDRARHDGLMWRSLVGGGQAVPCAASRPTSPPAWTSAAPPPSPG